MSHHYLIGDCIISSVCLLAKQAHATPILSCCSLLLSSFLKACPALSHPMIFCLLVNEILALDPWFSRSYGQDNKATIRSET